MFRLVQLRALYGHNLILCNLLLLYHQIFTRLSEGIQLSLSHKYVNHFLLIILAYHLILNKLMNIHSFTCFILIY